MMISKEDPCKTFCKHGYRCLQTDISLDNLNCQFFRGADNCTQASFLFCLVRRYNLCFKMRYVIYERRSLLNVITVDVSNQLVISDL